MSSEIQSLVDAGAIFYCSHSGGKDSQAMYGKLVREIPSEQLVVIHASLGEVEWPGIIEHIKDTISHELQVVSANKTFFEMVEHRQRWPSPAYRQCTSDLKRGPIMKFIRNDLKARGAEIAVNCMGLRAEESNARRKKSPFEFNKAESVNNRVKRAVYNWLPVFEMTKEQVFDFIYSIGQKPFWAYGERGELNDRISCVICIMGCVEDLRHGAINNPFLFRLYVETENRTGHTMFMKNNKPIGLEEYIGIKVEDLIDIKVTA